MVKNNITIGVQANKMPFLKKIAQKNAPMPLMSRIGPAYRYRTNAITCDKVSTIGNLLILIFWGQGCENILRFSESELKGSVQFWGAKDGFRNSLSIMTNLLNLLKKR